MSDHGLMRGGGAGKSIDNVGSSPDDSGRRRVYTKAMQQVDVTLDPPEELVLSNTHLAEAGPTEKHSEGRCMFRA
jgi:hypothetical protein